MMLRESVLKIIETVFGPARTEDHLEESEGRVYGTVTVVGSPKFDGLTDVRRQQLLWNMLSDTLGADAGKVGPVVLKPTNRG